MRQYTDELTRQTEYVMNSAELMRYRYNIIKDHEMKKKRRRKRFIKNLVKEIAQGAFAITALVVYIYLCLYLSLIF